MTIDKLPQQFGSLTVEQTIQQAIVHHQAGQLQDAEQLYRAILQPLPNHPDANRNLGVLAIQANQLSASLLHFKVALEVNPNQGQFWPSYIEALIQSGQSDAAQRVLEQGRHRGLQGEAVIRLASRLAGSGGGAVEAESLTDPQLGKESPPVSPNKFKMQEEKIYDQSCQAGQTCQKIYPATGK